MSKEKRFYLKQKRRELEVAESDFKEAQKTTSVKQREVQLLRSEVLKLEQELTKTSDSIGVSDHAVLRYLERKFNLDIESIREELLTSTVVGAIKSGATSVKMGNMTLKIQGKTVTTII